jgi:uncharacterized MAPEG superfamily protein
MKVVIISLLVLALLPIVLAWVSGYFRHRQFGSVDNKMPRLQNAQLAGVGHRAHSAQQNAWEALAIFSAAVLALLLAGIEWSAVTSLCVILLIARVLHAVFYLANQDILRSLTFLVSYGICIYFFYLALAGL